MERLVFCDINLSSTAKASHITITTISSTRVKPSSSIFFDLIFFTQLINFSCM